MSRSTLRISPRRWLGAVALVIACLGYARAGEEAKRPYADALQAELEKTAGHGFRQHVAGLLVVVSDAPDEKVLPVLKHLYKVLPRMRAYARFPNDSPTPDHVLVALFDKRADCEAFFKARNLPWGGSFDYLHDAAPDRRLIAGFVLAEPAMEARLRVAAMDLLLRAWIQNPPRWLRVGLIEAMEDATFDDEGRLGLGPARYHIRDLREKVLGAKEPTARPYKELVALPGRSWPPNDPAPVLQSWALVRAMLDQADLREAGLLPSILKALKPDGSRDDNRAAAAKVFPGEGWDELEKTCRAYLAALPETAGEEPYRQARGHILAHRFKDAVAALDTAIELDPEYARLYFFRAQAHFYAGEQEPAGVDAGRALALFPEYHAARFLRARVRKMRGDAEGAFEDFRGCLRTAYHQRAMEEIGKLQKSLDR